MNKPEVLRELELAAELEDAGSRAWEFDHEPSLKVTAGACRHIYTQEDCNCLETGFGRDGPDQ